MNTLYNNDAHRLAVAPMMARTDRHCRAFHRVLAPRAMLYTEMITADAIRYGDAARFLRGGDSRTVLQLGGSDPASLAEAVGIAGAYDFAEYNLNVGCPSDRVQSGKFGACLMAEPDLVARITSAMIAAAAPQRRAVSVKCRIGIDDMPPEALDDFIARVAGEGGVRHFIIHARKAWLKGLSPKENREIPPLDYDRVRRLRDAHPGLAISINGGIDSVVDAKMLAGEFTGVMIGRAAYARPAVLAEMAAAIYGEGVRDFSAPDLFAPDLLAIARAMEDYAGAVMETGVAPLTAITRHMLGLTAGMAGARGWRHALSVEARHTHAKPALIMQAAQRVMDANASRMAA